MAGKTATVETLTAEVRVLVVGSRQVTMSVYNQLDRADFDQIEPFGRVTPKDASGGVCVIGKRRDGAGDLVRSWLPTTQRDLVAFIKRESSADAYERQAAAHEDAADRRETKAALLDELAEKLLTDAYISGNESECTQGAAQRDKWAAQRADDAARAESDARAADSGTERLAYLAIVARKRHEAAVECDEAAKARAESERCRTDAQQLRHDAQEFRKEAKASTTQRGTWLEWEDTRTDAAEKAAAEWSVLPLIVLAGLR
jgi:hypothetical protein